MNIYKARWLNALKQAAKVNRLIKKGFIVLNKEGEREVRFKYRKETRTLYQQVSQNVSYSIFENNKRFDGSLYTKISEFNKRFDGWQVIHPKNILKLSTKIR